MMKVLLVALNASYMHTNPAVRSLKYYAEKHIKNCPQIDIQEFTINQPYAEILRGIEKCKGDLILFSTYIWNAELTSKIISDVKKICPDSTVGCGGPEFGYGAEKYLQKIPALDFVIFGEGEKIFTSIVNDFSAFKKELDEKNICSVHGIYYRKNISPFTISFSGYEPLIENLDEIEFLYPELLSENYDGDNKIYYYESSRGCPFSCSYCLSSVEKNVRFKSLEKVYRELKVFLDADVKLVKFVDRTYNLDEERYISIWRYILEHHNKKTMFHFEIEAEYLSENALCFLSKVPKGVMQFEIGVQTSNKKTLKAINRSDNIEKLSENIKRIPRTIHQHLDLIAGLPYENLESFGKSFDFVMALKPDALQLGFLKVLSGTMMEKFAKENNYRWMELPVYEIISTPFIDFSGMVFLKDVELLTDVFWNKKIFSHTADYLFRIISPWNFFSDCVEYARRVNVFDAQRRDLFWFEFFYGYIQQKFNSPQKDVLADLLRYDYILTGKKGNFPSWYEHRYDKEQHKMLLEEKKLLHSNRLAFATTEYEEFNFDVESSEPEKTFGNYKKLIIYSDGKR